VHDVVDLGIRWNVHGKSIIQLPTALSMKIELSSHPDAKYTLVGPLNKDQFEDYSERKGQSLEETERWLAPNRGY
jgi:hypothetical protein